MGLGIEELGNAEIEQTRPTVRTDEEVPRLQVTVHDAAPMGELDRLEHGEHKLDAARERKCQTADVGDEILARDVLERQEPGAVGSTSALNEAGDSRMLERRQDAHLVAADGAGLRRGCRSGFMNGTRRAPASWLIPA